MPTRPPVGAMTNSLIHPSVTSNCDDLPWVMHPGGLSCLSALSDVMLLPTRILSTAVVAEAARGLEKSLTPGHAWAVLLSPPCSQGPRRNSEDPRPLTTPLEYRSVWTMTRFRVAINATRSHARCPAAQMHIPHHLIRASPSFPTSALLPVPALTRHIC